MKILGILLVLPFWVGGMALVFTAFGWAGAVVLAVTIMAVTGTIILLAEVT